MYNRNAGQITLASGLNVLAAIWLIFSPFILAYADFESSAWNAIIVGTVVGLIALIRAIGARSVGWLSWVNAALGVWLIASPWIFGNSDVSAILWNDLIVGAVIAILGAWSALATETSNT